MARGKDYTVSLDVGTNTLKGVVVSREQTGQMTLEAYGSVKTVGLDKGEVKDAVALKQSIQKLIEDLTGQMGKKDVEADFKISFTDGDYSVFSENIEEVLSEDKQVMVKEQTIMSIMARLKAEKMKTGNTNIHRSYIRKYILDDDKVVFNPVEMYAKKLNVEMVFVSSEGKSVEIFRRLFEELFGRGDFFISPALISASEAVLTDTEKQHGVVSVVLGHSFSEMVIYRENLPVYISRIPLGIRHIVLDVARVLGTSVDEAERLLVNYGHCSMFPPDSEDVVEYFGLDERTRKNVSVRRLSTVIYARVKELLNKIRKEIQLFVINNPEYSEERIPGGVVFTGGGSKLRGLTDVGVESLKMPVRIGTYETSFNKRIENSHDVANDPVFSSCLGNLVSPEEVQGEAVESVVERPKKGFGSFIKSLFFGGEDDEL
ncbi:MAG TPA: cell division protein FtsA [Mesotoga infera]|jgi:cell division protein FtsA|uniref:Cell division protein FtsA n=2 Tax=Mesotoga TaxID=1184396 RepID=A0A101GZL7_9BACT|nr:MAG: Cell division protein FtsA [Mesotoga infera]KUK90800.1 MAG: Cell division protein FtsA [Mesotoga infera]HCO70128.1 cell division protein FtsA [Mesotoga infera]